MSDITVHEHSPAMDAAETPTPALPEHDPPAEPRPPTLLAIGRQRLDALRSMMAAETPDVEFVHDLRVATRRLTEVMGVLEPLLDPPAADAVADTLRQTRRCAGDLRDLDVLGEHLQKWRFPQPLKKARQEILDSLPAQREPLTAQLHDHLQGTGVATALAVLARALEAPAHAAPECQQKLAALLKKRIKRRRKELAEALGQAARKQTSKALHQARIAVKKLRYALELADEAALVPCKGQLKFLKKMQTHLGDLHDTDIIVATLERQLAPVSDPEARKAGVAWRQWFRQTQNKQAERAAVFFAQSYLWMNKAV